MKRNVIVIENGNADLAQYANAQTSGLARLQLEPTSGLALIAENAFQSWDLYLDHCTSITLLK